MTKDQVAELIEQIPDFLTPDEFLVALATKAAEVEREACAKVCEKPIDEIQITDDCSEMVYMGGLECATAIRARGEK